MPMNLLVTANSVMIRVLCVMDLFQLIVRHVRLMIISLITVVTLVTINV